MASFRRVIVQRIDREKVCPLLLRVFVTVGDHHTAEDFADPKSFPRDVQIYTWKDATLRELTDLIKGIKKEAQHHTARLSFAFVYPDRSGKNTVRVVGQTYSARRSESDRRTLADLQFETGDYLDVAIHL